MDPNVSLCEISLLVFDSFMETPHNFNNICMSYIDLANLRFMSAVIFLICKAE